MKLYYAETGIGACLREAVNLEVAQRKILAEVGTFNGVQRIREATAADIAWIKAMQGCRE